MKLRSEGTTSERQLIMAMAGHGRPTSLAELSAWRSEGLLPPLASHGLGKGSGKCYYWRERNIVAHACAAFDLLAKFGRPDAALWILWLQGFHVPPSKLRRVWKSRGRLRRLAVLSGLARNSGCDALSALFDGLDEGADIASIALMECVLTISDAMGFDGSDKDRAMASLIDRALARVGRDYWASSNIHMTDRLWRLFRIVGSALDGSDLVTIASDLQLREAQQFLRIPAQLLQSCDSSQGHSVQDGSWWSSELAEILGPPLISLILVLLISGRHNIVVRIADVIENRGWREPGSQALRYYHA